MKVTVQLPLTRLDIEASAAFASAFISLVWNIHNQVPHEVLISHVVGQDIECKGKVKVIKISIAAVGSGTYQPCILTCSSRQMISK